MGLLLLLTTSPSGGWWLTIRNMLLHWLVVQVLRSNRRAHLLPYSSQSFIVHCPSSTTCTVYGGGSKYQQTSTTAFTRAIPSTNVDITYIREGNTVTCYFGGSGSVTANSTTTISSSAAVPSSFRPKADIWYVPNLQSNTGSFVNGLANFTTAGNITFYATGSQGNFTNTNVIVLRSFCTTWLA